MRRWGRVVLVLAAFTLASASLAHAGFYDDTGTSGRGGSVIGGAEPEPVPLPSHLRPSPVTAPPVDVPPTHWAAGAINQLRGIGLLVGDPDGSFKPEAQVSNAETVTIFLRLLGLTPRVGYDEAHWAQPALEQAVSLGWIPGDRVRNPDEGMDRLAVAVMLARALRLEPVAGAPPWPDVAGLPPEVVGYLQALHRTGLFRGYPDGTFRPGRVVTRAEVAMLVSRILAGVPR